MCWCLIPRVCVCVLIDLNLLHLAALQTRASLCTQITLLVSAGLALEEKQLSE